MFVNLEVLPSGTSGKRGCLVEASCSAGFLRVRPEERVENSPDPSISVLFSSPPAFPSAVSSFVCKCRNTSGNV